MPRRSGSCVETVRVTFSLCLIMSLPTQFKEKSDWTLCYWNYPGRGNFIRLLFAYKQIPFIDISHDEQMSEIFVSLSETDQLYSNPEIVMKNHCHSPPFAPPCIIYFDKVSQTHHVLSQTIAATCFVAEKIGLTPKNDANNDETIMLQKYQAIKLLADCYDIMNEIYTLADNNTVRNTYNQTDLRQYFDTRFQKWLYILSYPLKSNNKYYFGNSNQDITYVDLSVAHMLDALHGLMGNKIFNIIFAKYPNLIKLYQNVISIETVAKFRQQQKKAGIGSFSKEKVIDVLRPILLQQYINCLQIQAKL